MTLLKIRTKEKSWRNAILNLPDCPRGFAVAAFCLACKHGCLYVHLYRFEFMDSPACPLCLSGVTMDVDHLLKGMVDYEIRKNREKYRIFVFYILMFND